MIRLFILLSAPLITLAHPAIETRINDLDKAIEEAPLAPELYLMRGRLFASHGNKIRAKQDFESARALNDNTQVQLALGNLYLSNADYQNASDSFAHALQMDSGNSLAWLGLAKASTELGAHNLALLSYRNYFDLEANPQPGYFAAAVRAVAFYNRPEAQRLLKEGLERLGPVPALTDLFLALGFHP